MQMFGTVYKALLPGRAQHTLRRNFDQTFCKNYTDKATLGNRCPWTILTRRLNSGSVVYSGGVGEDISFELELIERFGLTVHIFDPSPMALDTIAAASRYGDKLHFKPLGLTGSGSSVGFVSLDDRQTGLDHWGRSSGSRDVVSLPCTILADEMKANGHSRIDLLKIDIEGFEYEVLDSCLKGGVLPSQICVEFHHFMKDMPSRATTALLLLRLWQNGYDLIHKHQYDYTLHLRAQL
jgi:FkbM family methyltransferase